MLGRAIRQGYIQTLNSGAGLQLIRHWQIMMKGFLMTYVPDACALDDIDRGLLDPAVLDQVEGPCDQACVACTVLMTDSGRGE